MMTTPLMLWPKLRMWRASFSSDTALCCPHAYAHFNTHTHIHTSIFTCNHICGVFVPLKALLPLSQCVAVLICKWRKKAITKTKENNKFKHLKITLRTCNIPIFSSEHLPHRLFECATHLGIMLAAPNSECN